MMREDDSTDVVWTVVELSIACTRLADLLNQFLDAVGQGMPLQPIKHRIEAAADKVIITWCGESKGDRETAVKEAAHEARLLVLQFPDLVESPRRLASPIASLSSLTRQIQNYSVPYPQASETETGMPAKPPKGKRGTRRQNANANKLTERQTDVARTWGECDGNAEEAGKRLGITGATVRQTMATVNKKLSKHNLKHATRRAGADRRGNIDLADGDDHRE